MDKILKEALENELKRQDENIELIASENYVSKAILKLQGSILTNKYAEGYPDKRYYGGCEYIDVFEKKAIEYACDLFKAKYANVQPHSGSSSNMAAYKALLNKGDVLLGLNLAHGGHLTHGHKVNFSGSDYQPVFYNLNNETEQIDYDMIDQLAKENKPKMIVAGFSAYSGEIDFQKFRDICDKYNCYLMVDMAHIAGLVAAGYHQNPVMYADLVTSTTHKTLRGPRGGFILTNNEEIIKKINKAVFPGMQGGPLMHVIAAKAQCFYEASTLEFKQYIKNVLENAQTMSLEFLKNGVKVVSGVTKNHMMLLDVKQSFGLTGAMAEEILDKIGITVNKNTIFYDLEKPTITSGIRIGTAAITTRGFKVDDCKEVANIIITALQGKEDKEVLANCKKRARVLTSKYPFDNIK